MEFRNYQRISQLAHASDLLVDVATGCVPNADMSQLWNREPKPAAPVRLRSMRVGRHLKLRLILLRGRWALLIGGVAAALVWTYPGHSSGASDRLAMFGAALLYLWLVAKLAAVVIGLPKPRPRCPRCAHKVLLMPGMRCCPTCSIGFREKVRREWRQISPAQSPWITRPQTLRMGQLSRR